MFSFSVTEAKCSYLLQFAFFVKTLRSGLRFLIRLIIRRNNKTYGKVMTDTTAVIGPPV